jgi:hypothetical protein
MRHGRWQRAPGGSSRLRTLLLGGAIILAAHLSWAQSPLLLSKDAFDVHLSWSPTISPYTVLRGTAPDALVTVDSTPGESWTDAGAVGDGSDYFYAVEDSTGSRTNMGFKIERELWAGAGGMESTLIGLPYRPSFEDLDGDTEITSYDVLLDWWNGEDTVGIQHLRSGTCYWEGSSVGYNPFIGQIYFSGLPFAILDDPAEAYRVFVSSGAAPTRITIVGSHDDSVTETVVTASGCCRRAISIPYHTTYTGSDDILAAAFNGTDSLVAATILPVDVSWRERRIVPDDLGGGPPALTAGPPWDYETGLGVVATVTGDHGGATVLPLPHH